MDPPIVVQYETNAASALSALTAVVARLGHTLGAVDNQNGIVTFETGMSRSSWAYKMSAPVLSTGSAVQITISGTRKPQGAQLQIAEFGEARNIATKVFDQLIPILGQGQLIGGYRTASFQRPQW